MFDDHHISQISTLATFSSPKINFNFEVTRFHDVEEIQDNDAITKKKFQWINDSIGNYFK